MEECLNMKEEKVDVREGVWRKDASTGSCDEGVRVMLVMVL